MKVIIKNNAPSAAQRKVLRQEVSKEFNKLLSRYNKTTAVQVLHILHFNFGWGQKRLQQFADLMTEMQKDQAERYELPDSDIPWLCERQLKEDGINTEELINGEI